MQFSVAGQYLYLFGGKGGRAWSVGCPNCKGPWLVWVPERTSYGVPPAAVHAGEPPESLPGHGGGSSAHSFYSPRGRALSHKEFIFDSTALGNDSNRQRTHPRIFLHRSHTSSNLNCTLGKKNTECIPFKRYYLSFDKFVPVVIGKWPKK